MGVASLPGKYVLAEASPGCDRCPLSGVGRCPLSEVQMYSIYREVNGLFESILKYCKTSNNALRKADNLYTADMSSVRCIEVVRFSEGPLLKVLQYFNMLSKRPFYIWT